MTNKKYELDELQEQKMLKIERNGAWFAFWGLLAAIFIHILLNIHQENFFRIVAGEWVLFMCLSVYMVIACMKNGIWSRTSQPSTKTNLITSLISGVACGFFFALATYLKFQKLLGAIVTGVLIFILIFALIFIALTYSAKQYKKRIEMLEAKIDEDPDK